MGSHQALTSLPQECFSTSFSLFLLLPSSGRPCSLSPKPLPTSCSTCLLSPFHRALLNFPSISPLFKLEGLWGLRMDQLLGKAFLNLLASLSVLPPPPRPTHPASSYLGSHAVHFPPPDMAFPTSSNFKTAQVIVGEAFFGRVFP